MRNQLLGRCKRKRTVGRAMHIICEDLKSARYYLQGYKKDNNLKEYIILEPHEHTDPLHLVKDAKRIKDESPNDEVWVVYDLESPLSRNIKGEHAPAWQNARISKIKIALSCISFEAWILLHHTYTTKGFLNSNELEKHIKREFDQQYSKSDSNIFLKLKTRLKTAQKNAAHLDEHNKKVNHGKKPYDINPFTDIHKLLHAMLNFKNKHHSST